jgi:DNA-binding transcriptional LysR family regulator
MTLTELKYIVAVAREKHFGKAADACYVSQPTLSVAIKKLEEELDVKLFERSANEVTVTPLGEEIVRQAQSVLEQAANIKEIAKRGKDPLAGPLRLGVIYTIAPYLLPDLVRQTIDHTPQMPLMLQENFTVKLLEMLRTGEIDCAIMAEPFPDTGLAIAPLYDEPFLAVVPSTHALAKEETVTAEALKRETMLLLGQRPLFSRPRARGLPRVRALFQRRRGHPQKLRRLVARDHQAHGGRRHGRDARATPERAARRHECGQRARQAKARRRRLCALPAVRRRPAHPPRGAGLAAQLHALRGHRRVAQCDLRL